MFMFTQKIIDCYIACGRYKIGVFTFFVLIGNMVVSFLENLLNIPLPHIHDMIFDFLDVPAKRACLRTSASLRKFVLDRQTKLAEEER